MKDNCTICGYENIEYNIIGINKKLLGRSIENFFCIKCLAEYLECEDDELIDKIEEFKNDGCLLFR